MCTGNLINSSPSNTSSHYNTLTDEQLFLNHFVHIGLCHLQSTYHTESHFWLARLSQTYSMSIFVLKKCNILVVSVTKIKKNIHKWLRLFTSLLCSCLESEFMKDTEWQKGGIFSMSLFIHRSTLYTLRAGRWQGNPKCCFSEHTSEPNDIHINWRNFKLEIEYLKVSKHSFTQAVVHLLQVFDRLIYPAASDN